MSDKFYILTYLPSPGWRLSSFNLEVITWMGLKHLCSHCTEEFVEEFGRVPKTIDDVLWTRCGAEMSFEEYDDYFEEV